MALRIVNNLAALNTQRWLSVSDAGMKKSLERLSSGYRINRAADDAAGLAISQSFRANIASFKVASRNASEAGALLQVAEGGMDQIGNMLTRLKELSTQSASANVGDTERAKINSEATALIAEIDRIANSTKYGSTALLDGNFGASKIGLLGQKADTTGTGIVDDANDNIGYKAVYSTTNSTSLGATVVAVGSGIDEDKTWNLYISDDLASAYITEGTITTSPTNQEKIAISTATQELAFTNLGVTITFTQAVTDTKVQVLCTGDVSAVTTDVSTVTFTRTGLTSVNVANATTGIWIISDTGGSIKISNSTGTSVEVESFVQAGDTISFDQLNISFVLGSAYSSGGNELDGLKLTVSPNTAASGNTFQIGSENHADSQIEIAIGGVSTTTLGINSIDLSSSSGAQAALTLVDSAISTLAGSRGEIGASMNRLSYATANLASTIENVQAAESVIRDVDMAAEMTDFTKNQILLQAGTAMLAQANMAPQQVLALFG